MNTTETKVTPLVMSIEHLRMLVSVWRDSVDLRVTMPDSIKLHFMSNRREVLSRQADAAGGMLLLLYSLSPADPATHSAELDEARRLLSEHKRWVADELSKLEALEADE